MTQLALVLFVLGILVLIVGWRLGNSRNLPSPEVLATLKGLANTKRELHLVHKELREVEARLGDMERKPILAQESAPIQLGIIPETESLRGKSLNYDRKIDLYTQMFQEFQTNNSVFQEPRTTSSETRVLPEKYRMVLELHGQGLAVIDIASQLSMSQDAVNMVLRTHQRGGKI